MTGCIYISVWGFTEAKENFIGYFDKAAAKLIERDDVDFVYIPFADKEYSVMLFNLPMRATPKDVAIKYALHVSHAHILIEPSIEVAWVIKAYIPKCEGHGLIYTWHRIDAEEVGLELIEEPTNADEAMKILHRIATSVIERNLLLPPVLPIQPLEPVSNNVVLPELITASEKPRCKK